MELFYFYRSRTRRYNVLIFEIRIFVFLFFRFIDLLAANFAAKMRIFSGANFGIFHEVEKTSGRVYQGV